ncbi:MAG: hypothetical protein IT445_21235 [Phycisphaeraceae bacterium]|nr:hypothetical protein [Phycisphaeraceae bacterium]
MHDRIDPQNGFRLDKSRIEVVDLKNADPGVDWEWINHSTIEDRFRALEFLRWQAFGYDQATSRLQRVLEVAQREAS